MTTTFTLNQQSRINALLTDVELMKQTLTDPDALAEWVNYFFGDDGPFPTPCISTSAPRSPAVRRIRAQRNHPDTGEIYAGCYAYDDQFTTAEPLVHCTSELIDHAVACLEATRPGAQATRQWSPPPAVQLDFSDRIDQFDLEPHTAVLLELSFTKQDGEMSIYNADVIGPPAAAAEFSIRTHLCTEINEAHLCPQLLNYFCGPPEKFWAAITPLR